MKAPRVTERMRQKFPRVPYVGIEYAVGKLHVGTPEADIRAEYLERARKAGASKEEAREIVRWALLVHRYNGATYRWVMGAHLDGAIKRACDKANASGEDVDLSEIDGIYMTK